MDITLMWDYADEVITEDGVIAAARRDSIEFGVTAVSPSMGATLRLLAAAAGARAVCEVGTGAGVSGLYLLQGMHPTGVLSTVDSEAELQHVARTSFKNAGYSSARTRVFNGRALDLLPRMNSGAYDLVVLDGDPLETPYYLTHATRMLRRGGIVAVVHALVRGHVADPVRRDSTTSALRDVIREVFDEGQYQPCLLPCGDGIVAAVRL